MKTKKEYNDAKMEIGLTALNNLWEADKSIGGVWFTCSMFEQEFDRIAKERNVVVTTPYIAFMTPAGFRRGEGGYGFTDVRERVIRFLRTMVRKGYLTEQKLNGKWHFHFTEKILDNS